MVEFNFSLEEGQESFFLGERSEGDLVEFRRERSEESETSEKDCCDNTSLENQ